MPAKGHLENRGPMDARGAERRELQLEARGKLESGVQANLSVHNISTSGMLIETAEELRVGEQLLVHLPEAGEVSAEVVWSSDRLFGCKFAQAISAGSLAASQLRGDPLAPLGLGATQSKLGGVAFGKRLEQLRKARSMTLSDVAERLGVSKPTVWAWEKGKAKPIEDRFPALARVLGIEQDELLGMASPSGGQEALEEARAMIADAFGVTSDKIRVMIEL
ncbi:helix-turn-helix domain-containing protein [Altererythrobacter lutimaris]|uniref:Helix-turn-helix domain-containing protein n=1 Tax=Altererythrobacter lutimaris TaxID=2743979 RepID=A0A850HB91_9SPHN|nr:helix-turn-helix domain-containing protein [Altererythrobacter lutimaris]NVE95019.1 helix-turn-helix domain-containing protein [Altererythrobacter lutimaris]